MKPCIAFKVRYKYHMEFDEMLKTALMYKKRLVSKKNPKSEYLCVIFEDNSRLTFKMIDENIELISWFYYIK